VNKFLKSFYYALSGIRGSFRGQRNLKVQSAMALLTVGAGFYFSITATEWCIILLIIGLVLGLEMMNTAIEGLVDLVTLEHKPLAGRIKDIAAGAVLLASILAVIIGVIVFRKYCFNK
jgi:diacylglycerol kinase